jgi:hypothetical protein
LAAEGLPLRRLLIGAGIGSVYDIFVTDNPFLGSTKHYYANGQRACPEFVLSEVEGRSRRVAMRQGDVVYYIHADHLGSTSVLSDESGGQMTGSRVAYLPYGGVRLGEASTLPTDYTFTGQRDEAGIGLMHYGARFYSPRYSYVLNNPLKYVDPTGHQELAKLGLTLIGFSLVNSPAFPDEIVLIPAGLVCIASDPMVQEAVQGLILYGQYMPAYADTWFRAGEAAQQNARNYLDKGGNTGNADPNDPFRPFRDPGEKYQYQTSGTRYGEESTTLDVTVRGQARTVTPDNIVDEYLRESKYVDISREFYSKQMGRTGMTGLDWHVRGWSDQIERLSLAAEQHGYQGVKVFVSSQEALQKVIKLYPKSAFPNVEFIFQPLQ